MKTDAAVPIDPEVLRYARWLEAGTRLGFVVLAATFLAYLLGFYPGATPAAELPRYWSQPVGEYLKATGAATGWGWIRNLRYGDALTFFGIAIIGLVTIVCFVAVLPLFLRRGDRLYAAIAIAEIVVLVAAAAGWGGGH